MEHNNTFGRRTAHALVAALFIGSALFGLATDEAAAAVPSGTGCGPIIEDNIQGRYCIMENGLTKLFSHYDGKFLGYIHGGDPKELGVDPFADDNTAASAPGAPPTLQSNRYTAGAKAPHCVTPDSPDPAYYAHVIYARYKNEPDTYDDKKDLIREIIRETNGFLWDTTADLGLALQYKVHCTDGDITVSEAVLPNDCMNADCFTDMTAQLGNLGYNDPDVKYWVWTENTACGCGGKGNMYPDDRPGIVNRNNGNAPSAMYAVTFHGSTGVRVMMHENGHNMGAVQNSDTYAKDGMNNAAHCWDGTDIMCYKEPGEAKAYDPNVCPGADRWDCNHDTYCHTNPAPGSYLYDHWNLCASYNRYLVPANAAPLAVDDAFEILEDAPTLLMDIFDNDSDPDENDTLYFHSATNPLSGGTVTWNETTQLIEYNVGADFFGVDSFQYKVRDRENASNEKTMIATATVTINVLPVNDPPVADPDRVRTKEDTPVNIELTASDVENSPLTFTLVTPPEHGTLVGTLPLVQYVPDENWYDRDSFVFRVNDGALESGNAKVVIEIDPRNDAPTAGDDTALAFMDGPAIPIYILANDSPAPDDIDPLDNFDDETIAIDSVYNKDGVLMTSDAGGLVELNDAGTSTEFRDGEDDFILYTPPAGFESAVDGLDKITYRICDTDGANNIAPENKKPLCTEATVSIEVVDSDVVAFPDRYTTDEDTPLVVPMSEGVLYSGEPSPWTDNWPLRDTNGPANVQLEVITAPANGDLVMNDDGSFEYRPDLDFSGSDVFTYRFQFDGLNETGDMINEVSNEVPVYLTVLPVNDAPSATDDTVALPEDTLASITLAGFDKEDSLLGLPLGFEVLTQPTFGSLSGTAPELVYRPNSEYSGSDEFTFQVTDSQGATATGSITILVAPMNDPPVAEPDRYLVRPDQRNTISAIDGLLGNDVDYDGDDIVSSMVRAPDHGEVIVARDGSFQYTPDEGFLGVDAFTYAVTDETGESSFAVPVRLEVAHNIAPIADFDLKRTATDVDVSKPYFAIDESISFVDESYDEDGPIISWYWVFGDGSESRDQSPTHAFTQPGDYRVNLMVTDADGATATYMQRVLVSEDYSTEFGGTYDGDAPVADAGDPIEVFEGDIVEIQGTSPDKVIGWEWTQTYGQSVDIRDAGARELKFDAPTLEEGEARRTLHFQLTVFDGYKESLPDQVTVTVLAKDQTPELVASAGDDVQAYGGTEVLLTASSARSDATYTWRQLSGPEMVLETDGADLRFAAPYALEVQTMVFEARATAEGMRGVPDTVRVTVVPGLTPTGVDAVADATTVAFTPKAAGMLAQGLQYTWSFGDGEIGEGAGVRHAYDAPGTYDVTLTVRDDAGYQQTFHEKVIVQDTPEPAPVAATTEQSKSSVPVGMILLGVGLIAALGAAGFGLATFLRRP